MGNHESKRIIAKLVYLLKRNLDEWIQDKLCCPDDTCFNKSHLPLFMSIGTAGISNNELAANMNITKQAASKIIKDLEAIDLVKSEKSSADARSVMLYLTDKGTCLFDHIINQIQVLEEDYKKLVGAKNYETALNVMIKLIAYHEQQSKVAMK